jgi:hypothetical protein
MGMVMTCAAQRISQDIRELDQDLVQQLRERGIEALPDLIRQAEEGGYLIGARRMLFRQLQIRFGSQVDGDPERRVASASLKQVELWADRILSAQRSGGVDGPGSQSSNGFLRPSMQRTMRLSTHSATSCWPSNVSSVWPSW